MELAAPAGSCAAPHRLLGIIMSDVYVSAFQFGGTWPHEPERCINFPQQLGAWWLYLWEWQLVNSPAGLETRPPATNDRPGKKTCGFRSERRQRSQSSLAAVAASAGWKLQTWAHGSGWFLRHLPLSFNVITFRVGAIHHEGGDRRKDCFSNLVVTNNAALACTFHHRRAAAPAETACN